MRVSKGKYWSDLGRERVNCVDWLRERCFSSFHERGAKKSSFSISLPRLNLTISLVLLVYLLLLKNFPSRKILRIRVACAYLHMYMSKYAYEIVIKGTSCTYNQEITG